MIAVFRIILSIILCFMICLFGLIYCLFKPRNPENVSLFGRLFACMAPVFGIQLEVRRTLQKFSGNCVYIANHQNNFDMITLAYVVQPRTVTVGKKSLLWIPLFGLLYWLSGNLLIDRHNRIKSYNTLLNIIRIIQKKKVSVWMFPEGTRSRGRGLLPFKKGAFYVAVSAGVPIVPICISSLSNNKIRLNRFHNGLVIIDILSPIKTDSYTKDSITEITNYCYNLMKIRLDQLNSEVYIRDSIL